MIKAENISKSFQGTNVLNDVSATFKKGQNNLIIGQSGSGKTVMMKCIVGLLEVDKGNIFYDDRNFNKMSFKQRKELRREIGMLFQGGALFDSMNVEENVMFPLTMFTKWTYKERQDRVNFCLERVNLNNVNHLYPDELSGGMQKRVAIARAISMNPKYLFCDEPNSGLDPRTSVMIDELIDELTRDFEMTTIINTHDMNSVLSMGDQIIFINKGEIAWKGNKDEILTTNNKTINDFVYVTEMAKRLKG
ncbi:MAG: ATP-binding cassette domain-containing protein [Bacteroidales bacterium]|nr:ATP-binding cassette domain-containing protein [Bacteroidales bacterium]MCF8327131.1 ATP-binding cassette domain-containing protein [Bacteroidales bacterium]